MNAETPTSDKEHVLATKGETSLFFYLSLIAALFLLPIGLAFVMGISDRFWVGVAAIVVGILGLGNGLWMASLKVLISARGMVFRRWWKRREIRWDEVQCVRFSTAHERHGNYGGLVILEGNSERFLFIAEPMDFRQLKGYLAAHCAHAVIIDQDTETIRPPKAGDADSRLARTREAAHSMFMVRAWGNGTGILFVLLMGGLLLRGDLPPSKTRVILIVGVVIIGYLIADIYGLAKRLRR